MATNTPNNTCPGSPCNIQCLQGNMRRSKPSLLCLFRHFKQKHLPSVYRYNFPHGTSKKKTTANKLPDIPGDLFNCFTEKNGRAALITKGINSWRCPQYCTCNIVVCQAKFDNHLTYLVSMYLDQDILVFPPEFRERGECDIIIGADSNAHSTVWN